MKFYEKTANDILYVTTHNAVMAARNALNDGMTEEKPCEKKVLYVELIEFTSNLIRFENERVSCRTDLKAIQRIIVEK